MTAQMTTPQVPDGYELTKRKKPIYRRAWFIALLILVVAIAAMAASRGGGSSTPGGGSAGGVTVVYSIESDSPTVSASYATFAGGSVGQEQAGDVPAPWSKTVTADDGFLNSYTLVGQMTPSLDPAAAQGSTITCRVTVDGEVVSEQTSTGAYAVVTCSAS